MEFDKPQPTILEDMHFHSTFSDGKNSPAENAAEAYLLGLKRVCMIDHVRRDTTWVPEYVQAVNALKETYAGRMKILVGIEAKILNEAGDLDLPENCKGIDLIQVADHQFPYKDGVLKPDEVVALLEEGKAQPTELFEALIGATMETMKRYDNLIIAHLFSILPKVGLHEEDISRALLHEFAKCAVATSTSVEISERWQCPSERTVDVLLENGVEIVYSTDAHSREAIGRYAYVANMKRHIDSRLANAEVLAE